MEDARALAIVVGNLGGVGFLAWCLLKLHEKALVAFREEMATERTTNSAAVMAERAERLGAHDRLMTFAQQSRDDGTSRHALVAEQLGRIETEVRECRKLLEAGR